MRAVATAAALHDLGKVEDIKQAILASNSRKPLPGVPHEEAGIAQLIKPENDDVWAAALVAAHHAGLFDGNEQRERSRSVERPPLLRNLDSDMLQHVDRFLESWLRLHEEAGCPIGSPVKSSPPDPVSLRLALSCLVDADHSDTANHQWATKDPVRPRRCWDKRLANLIYYASKKPKTTDRERRRQRFFDACLGVDIDSSLLSCSAPVGSGKTLAVMAHLLKVAQERGLRHIFVVLPYTNIINQAVEEYRKALKLPGENPQEIVAELHHQAEFDSFDSRQLATLWRAPIIVTTAVAFFETLAGSRPGRLRKMHELPGSAIFVDEAHAAMPHHLWPMTWQWLETFCDHWRMHVVLGSGSLFRFWEQPGFLAPEPQRVVPELTPTPILNELMSAESDRVRPVLEASPLNADKIASRLAGKEGASVVVLNTVQSAATVAKRFRTLGLDTLHLSTALAPMDREPIIGEIKRRLLEEPERVWVLVATSCIEAGLDFSFRRGLRESASVASLLQLGGRVRRNEESWAGELISFHVEGEGITKHPMMQESSVILDGLLRDSEFERHDPSALLKMAFERSLRGQFKTRRDELYKLERQRCYPEVQKQFRVIESDTRLVVVHKPLIELLKNNEKVRFAELVKGSVQIFASKLDGLPCTRLPQRNEVWLWNGEYCPEFLGYLAEQEAIDSLYKAGGAFL